MILIINGLWEVLSSFPVTLFGILAGIGMSLLFYYNPSFFFNIGVNFLDFLNNTPEKYAKGNEKYFVDARRFWNSNLTGEAFLRQEMLKIMDLLLEEARRKYVTTWALIWLGYFALLLGAALFETIGYYDRCKKEIELYEFEKNYMSRKCLDSTPSYESSGAIYYSLTDADSTILNHPKLDLKNWRIYNKNGISRLREIPFEEDVIICPCNLDTFHVISINTGYEIATILKPNFVVRWSKK